MKIGTSYNSWALVYFHSAFMFSKHFHISKCFLVSKHFHIFKELLYFFQSAFIFLSKRFYFLSKRFYLNFLNVSQRLFIFSMCERYLFSYSKTLFSSCFNFWMWNAQFLDHPFDYFWYFKYVSISALIMYKTFDRLLNLTLMTRTQERFQTTTLVLCKTGVRVYETSRVAARSQLSP
jgi:hypothetical protein